MVYIPKWLPRFVSKINLFYNREHSNQGGRGWLLTKTPRPTMSEYLFAVLGAAYTKLELYG